MLLWLLVLRSKLVTLFLRGFVSWVVGLRVSYGVKMNVCRYVCGRGKAIPGLLSMRLLILTTLRLSACDV